MQNIGTTLSNSGSMSLELCIFSKVLNYQGIFGVVSISGKSAVATNANNRHSGRDNIYK